jgi:hypothetical protein
LATTPEQLEQVVAGTDQPPLSVDLRQTPQQELPESSALLDLAEETSIIYVIVAS